MGLRGTINIFSQSTLNELFNNKAVYRTAPATPGISISSTKQNIGKLLKIDGEKILCPQKAVFLKISALPDIFEKFATKICVPKDFEKNRCYIMFVMTLLL